MKKYFLFAFVFTLLVLSIPVFAQTDDMQIPNVVDCFDYYQFGSVNADMTSRNSNAMAGMTMDFSGDIKNNNKYPIVAGTLYVKIFRNVGGDKNPNGPDVVDQFIALDNITIPANGSVPASFSWKVPAFAQGGNYQLVTYFTSDKKFNILGLSFSDSAVGNTFNFTVSGEKTGVAFDKSSVVMNSNPYYFSAYTAPIPKDANADISVKIINTTNQLQNVKTFWKLYKSDGVNPNNLIRTFGTSTAIKPNSSGIINLSIPEKNEPVYYLVGELTYKDTKSIVGIKFVRDGVDKARFNFASITSYPLKRGETETVFACLNNIGSTEQVSNGKVVLEVKDKNGKNVDSYTYEGVITKGIMAVKNDFISKVNLDIFSVHASLYTNGKLVDESVMKYDCNLIDPLKCSPDKNNFWNIISIAGGILALIILIIVMKILKKKKAIITPIAMLILGFCLFSPSITEAKSISWSTAINEIHLKYYRMDNDGWGEALRNPIVTTNYSALIKNTDTNIYVEDNSSVPVGTHLSFEFGKHTSGNVSWYELESTNGPFYGGWAASSATVPPLTCNSADYVKINEGKKAYIPLIIGYPTKTITGIGSNLSCGAITGNESSGYKMSCTVTGIGSINPVFNFSTTKGLYYYRYLEGTTCRGNDTPLEGNHDHYEYLNLPAKTISYTLNGITVPVGNHPPLAPTVTGIITEIITGSTSIPYSFTAVSTDPDGDQIKYGFDWNENGTVDYWSPFVNSGLSQNALYSWGSVGKKSFQVLAQDVFGTSSPWTKYSLEIKNNTSNTSSFSVNCSADPVEINENVIFNASYSNGTAPVTYLWSPSNTTGSQFTLVNGYSDANLYYNVKVKGTDALGKTSEATCYVTVGYSGTGGGVTVEIPSDLPCLSLDGVVVSSTTPVTFYSSRIAKDCLSGQAICKDGNLMNYPLVPPGTLFNSTTFRFKKCVEPTPREF